MSGDGGCGGRGREGGANTVWCAVVIFQNLYLAAPINRFIFFNLGILSIRGGGEVKYGSNITRGGNIRLHD